MVVKGFLESKKLFGKMAFFTLRKPLEVEQKTKRIQFITKDAEKIEAIKKCTIESYIKCEGLPETGVTSNLKSYKLLSFESVNPCLDPAFIDFSKSKLKEKDFTYLKDPFYLKCPSFLEIFLKKNKIYESICSFLREKKFVELKTPKLVNFGSEGGAQIYTVKSPFEEESLYLVQSPQVFKQLAINSGLKKIFEIGYIYRAEKFKTSRHLNEALCLDVELYVKDLKYMLLMIRDLLIRVSNDLNKEFPETQILNRKDFKTITYSKAVKLLKIDFGSPLETQHEFQLVRLCKRKFLFVTNYPPDLRTFYTLNDQSFDLLTSFAEICSGSLRTMDFKDLTESLKRWKVPESTLTYYLNSFKKGPQSSMGFGLGLDRLITYLLELQNVQNSKIFRNEQISE